MKITDQTQTGNVVRFTIKYTLVERQILARVGRETIKRECPAIASIGNSTHAQINTEMDYGRLARLVRIVRSSWKGFWRNLTK